MKDSSTSSSAPEQGGQDPTFYDGSRYNREQSVGYWIKHAYQSLQRNLDGAMHELDLTGMQWGPLWLIGTFGADNVAACAREAGMDAGAMTRMLDRLEAKGLIERERSTQDRRVVHLRLTPRGEEVVARIPHRLAGVLNRQLRGFSLEEFQTLLELLQRFVRNGSACGDASVPSDNPQP
ncbi:MAG: MarR family transcriptional regulator [Betaproteobacteria bacterium]|nr:MarR family transcriptional regulator [Betaproteobacteria bacterium]